MGDRRPVTFPTVPVVGAPDLADIASRFGALLRAAGVPVTTASDAHRLGDVAMRSADLRVLVEEAGYTELCAFERRTPKKVGL